MMAPEVFELVAWLVFMLVFTVIVEVGVAALFRVGLRGIAAVALVNVVTNPALNLAIFGYYFLMAPDDMSTALLAIAVVLEPLAVLAEWRLLVWSLKGTKGGSGKMFALALVMNSASFLAGLYFWHVV